MRDRIESMFNYLAAIPQDKLLHFFYGYVIFRFILLFGNIYIALAVVTIIAIAKEIWDYRSPNHEASIWDIVFTISSGVIETLINLI